MKPGPSSAISKAVLEVFASSYLGEPAVVFLSESGNKVVERDDELARSIGLAIQADKNLPDMILVDLKPTHPLLVFIEVVATDGPVSERRKEVYRERVLATVEAVMREELAQLASEEIFSTEARLAVAATALDRLRTDLLEFHCLPDQVLIRAVRFPDGYEARLQEKQLTYQKLELAVSKRAVEDQTAITDTSAAEISAAEKELRGVWDKRLQTSMSENAVAIASIVAEANIYDQQTRAEADALYETSIANGNLAIQKAEALRNELRNQALDTKGGRIYLAQKAAENLEFESVTLNSNDPRVPSILDLGALTRLLIGEDPEDDE